MSKIDEPVVEALHLGKEKYRLGMAIGCTILAVACAFIAPPFGFAGTAFFGIVAAVKLKNFLTSKEPDGATY